MSDTLQLVVNGAAYGGWTTIDVQRSIEQLAHAFSLQFVDRWTDDDRPIPLREGDDCLIKVNGEILITGYIDDIQMQETKDRRTLSATGRSKTGDLVDCAAIHKTGQWRRPSLSRVATDLCAPFGITVSGTVDLSERLKRKFAIQEGERVFETLSRFASLRGMLLQTDPDGNLVFTRGTGLRVETTLERGKNILSASRSGSWRERFSEYTIKGQQAGGDDFFGEAVTTPSVTVEDTAITRYRPTVIVAGTPAGKPELRERVTWERNVRAGLSQRYECTVQGWTNGDVDPFGDARLWQPNDVVHVIDARAEIDADLLIVSTKFVKDQSGTITALTLAVKEAYDVLTLPEPKPRAEGWP